MSSVLTIGQLARAAGVSTRTVRFYEQRGLLPDAERAANGYRTYGADAVIRLARVTALASSGVPLGRIRDLLDAPPAEFGAGVAAIDGELQQKMRELRDARRRLALLESSERLCLPELVVGFLDRLREAGARPDLVTDYRDAWILSTALLGDVLDRWLAEYGEAQFGDPAFAELTVATFAIVDAEADDPAVVDVALATVDWMLEHQELMDASWEAESLDPAAGEVMAAYWRSSPAWQRLGELIVAEVDCREQDVGGR